MRTRSLNLPVVPAGKERLGRKGEGCPQESVPEDDKGPCRSVKRGEH
jgi:hypothetical protein